MFAVKQAIQAKMAIRGLVMDAYIQWVSQNPIFSACVQFAILGSLGEIVAASVVNKRPALPCSWLQMLGKVVAWAILGVVIKYGFAGMKGFTTALLDHHMLPRLFSDGAGFAFALSVFTNGLFGPQMMLFHRFEDNLILGAKGYAGIEKALKTLLWFWIPAHTITFCLPTPFQIGLAAIWGLVLGLILGLSKKSA
ncbi:MAG: hypothetical protein LBH03_00230 [Holophagales bacterium]|nr:hypothetical protein [Holophagales bacterium]